MKIFNIQVLKNLTNKYFYKQKQFNNRIKNKFNSNSTKKKKH